MTRADLFKRPLPTDQAQALQFLRDLETLGLDYHLDDDPTTVISGARAARPGRTFTDAEAAYLTRLVPTLNRLFLPAEGTAGQINAGAWEAAKQAGWVGGNDEDFKEEAQQLVDELIGGRVLLESQDPTHDEMLAFLRKEFVSHGYGSESLDDDYEVAIYWFANDHHGGQNSNLYSALSTSEFTPGPNSSLDSEGEIVKELYAALQQQYAPSAQEP